MCLQRQILQGTNLVQFKFILRFRVTILVLWKRYWLGMISSRLLSCIIRWPLLYLYWIKTHNDRLHCTMHLHERNIFYSLLTVLWHSKMRIVLHRSLVLLISVLSSHNGTNQSTLVAWFATPDNAYNHKLHCTMHSQKRSKFFTDCIVQCICTSATSSIHAWLSCDTVRRVCLYIAHWYFLYLCYRLITVPINQSWLRDLRLLSMPSTTNCIVQWILKSATSSLHLWRSCET